MVDKLSILSTVAFVSCVTTAGTNQNFIHPYSKPVPKLDF